MTRSQWQIDREAVIEGLRNEARKLRSQKERGPAFHAPWGQDIIDANNAKADLFTEAANMIEALSSRPAPMEAVAWRVRDKDDPRGWWLYGVHETETVAELKRQEHEVQALAVTPTHGGGND